MNSIISTPLARKTLLNIRVRRLTFICCDDVQFGLIFMLSMCVLIMNKFYDASNKALINFKMTLNCCWYARNVCTLAAQIRVPFFHCFVLCFGILCRDFILEVDDFCLEIVNWTFYWLYLLGVFSTWSGRCGAFFFHCIPVQRELQGVVSKLYLIFWKGMFRLRKFLPTTRWQSKLGRQKGQVYWALWKLKSLRTLHQMRFVPEDCQFQKTFQHVLSNQFMYEVAELECETKRH